MVPMGLAFVDVPEAGCGGPQSKSRTVQLAVAPDIRVKGQFCSWKQAYRYVRFADNCEAVCKGMKEATCNELIAWNVPPCCSPLE